MKKATLFVVFLLLVTGAWCEETGRKSPGSKTIARLSEGKLDLTIPEVGVDVKRVTLDNGIIVYLYEDHRLPMVNVSSIIRCGSIYDDDVKDGLSGLVGTVMRTGGTKNISGDSLNMLMEYMGGSLETSIGTESGSASLSVLSKDLDRGLGLYADLLRNPAFPQDKLDLAKTEIKNRIKRRNDDPATITNRYVYHTLYGEHPYGRVLEWATIKGITPVDLVTYHQRFFVPNNLLIGVSGDFSSDELVAKLKQYLGDWPRSSEPLPAIQEVAAAPHPGVFLIKKDINQTNLGIAHLGIKRDNPDRFAINIMNYILGGGSFTSRLTSRVRSDEGLAYHVSSSFDIGSRDYGMFRASCQTKAASTYKATRIIVDEIERIAREGVNEQELTEARESLMNRLVFNFDNAGKIVRNLMALEFDGYPLDYYKTYFDNYRKVTRADVQMVAGKYLKPGELSFIVVGNPATFDKSLDEFGPVTTIELAPPSID
ncbi:MAG: pitrilysin family protein [Candidatus Zixiibacteriota bacterium]